MAYNVEVYDGQVNDHWDSENRVYTSKKPSWEKLWARSEQKQAETRAVNLSKEYPEELFRVFGSYSRWGNPKFIGYWINGEQVSDDQREAVEAKFFGAERTWRVDSMWGSARILSEKWEEYGWRASKAAFDDYMKGQSRSSSYYRLSKRDADGNMTVVAYWHYGYLIDHDHIVSQIAYDVKSQNSEDNFIVPKSDWNKFSVLKEDDVKSENYGRVSEKIDHLSADVFCLVDYTEDRARQEKLMEASQLLMDAAKILKDLK